MMTGRKVEVYTQPGCAPCKEVKEFLTARGIPFTEYDVTKDSDALGRLLDEIQSRQTPTIVIGDEVIRGFDRERLTRLLDS